MSFARSHRRKQILDAVTRLERASKGHLGLCPTVDLGECEDDRAIDDLAKTLGAHVQRVVMSDGVDVKTTSEIFLRHGAFYLRASSVRKPSIDELERYADNANEYVVLT